MEKQFINSQNSLQGNQSILTDLTIDLNTFNHQEPFTEEDSQFIQDLLNALGTNNTNIILKQINILDTDIFEFTNYIFTFEILGTQITEEQVTSEYLPLISHFMYRYNDSTENAGSYQIIHINGTNTFQAFFQIG